MPHKRERFERTDVPRPSHVRNVVSVVVLAAVAIGLYMLVTNLWTRANLESHLGERNLTSAVESQAELADLTGEYVQSQDSFQSVLVLTVSSLDDGATLSSAELLVLDVTANTGVLVSIPATVSVSYNGSAITLADLYQSAGASACVTSLGAATNVSLSHVIVATTDVWGQVAALAGSDANTLIMRGADLLSNMNTDMSTQELLDLATLVQSVGVDNLARVDAPTYADGYTAEDGSWVETGVAYIDKQAFCVAVGTLAPASADGGTEGEAAEAEATDASADEAAAGA